MVKETNNQNKRVGNILAKFDGELAEEIDLALLQEDAEKALAESVEVKAAAAAGDATAVPFGAVRATFEDSKQSFLADLPVRFAA